MNSFAHKTRRAAGFTLIELLVVVSIIALLIGILLPALGRARKQAQQLTCGTQVREIQRGLLNFAQDNNDNYPAPSTLDGRSYTEAVGGTPGTPSLDPDEDQRVKNRSGAIMSVLLFDGQVVTQMAVSPAEIDGTIRPDTNYQTSNPELAAEPGRALWDPSFIGTRDMGDTFWELPVAGQLGQGNRNDDIVLAGAGSNFSYAHIPLIGSRLNAWGATYSANEIIMGNRGPVYREGDVGGAMERVNQTWELEGTPTGSGSPGQTANQGFQSPTLLIHGNKRSWSGNLVYNDNHVEFSSSPVPQNARFSYTTDGMTEQVPDNIFFDEEWEVGEDALAPASRTNVYLRQWAGSVGQSNYNTINPDTNFPGDWGGNTATWDGKTTWGFGN